LDDFKARVSASGIVRLHAQGKYLAKCEREKSKYLFLIRVIEKTIKLWQVFVEKKKIHDSGIFKTRKVTGIYKNINEEQMRKAGRNYNSVASLLRQQHVPLLTTENVPNAIKGHETQGKRCKKHESVEFSTIENDMVDLNEEYVTMHFSRRHVCRCPREQFLSMIEFAIMKGVTEPAAVKSFGEFSKPIEINPTKLYVSCCGIMSTGGQCLTHYDPLDTHVILIVRNLLNEKEMSASCYSGSFNTVAEYKAFVENQRRCALQRKYGSSIYTYCPEKNCPMHNDGFFIEEILQKYIKGDQVGDYQRGYHATCPSCKNQWCIVCKTHHPRQVCRGPYTKYIPEIEKSAINDYKLEHCNDPSENYITHHVNVEMRRFQAAHDVAPNAVEIESLRKSIINDYKIKNGPEPDKKTLEECFNKKMREFLLTNKICPYCKILAHKSDGCNQIPCKCGQNWCFRCGGHRDPNPMLSHTHKCPEGIDYDVPFNSISEQ
jgi:hypothetical protein